MGLGNLESIPGANQLSRSLTKLVNWLTTKDMVFTFTGESCCTSALFDEYTLHKGFSTSLDEASVLIVSGPISEKTSRRIKEQFVNKSSPTWVIALGNCAISGGLFFHESYSVIRGIDNLVATDLYIPGCPPDQSAFEEGFALIKEKIGAHTETHKAVKPDPRQFSQTEEQFSIPRAKSLHGDKWEEYIPLEIKARMDEERRKLEELENQKREEEQRALEEARRAEELEYELDDLDDDFDMNAELSAEDTLRTSEFTDTEEDIPIEAEDEDSAPQDEFDDEPNTVILTNKSKSHPPAQEETIRDEEPKDIANGEANG